MAAKSSSSSDTALAPGSVLAVGTVLLGLGVGATFVLKSRISTKSSRSIKLESKSSLKKVNQKVDTLNRKEKRVSFDVAEPEMELSPTKQPAKTIDFSRERNNVGTQSKIRELNSTIDDLRAKLRKEKVRQRKLEEQVEQLKKDNLEDLKNHEIGLTRAFERKLGELRSSYSKKLKSLSNEQNQKDQIDSEDLRKQLRLLKEEKQQFEKEKFDLRQNQIQLNGAMAKLEDLSEELEAERKRLETSYGKEFKLKDKTEKVAIRKADEVILGLNLEKEAETDKQAENFSNKEKLLVIERERRQLDAACILGLVAFIFAW
mmetsp:Transcript_16522/g.20045  ORF Transcript_16522/g.20045 Transcript_16522/m.20045 type:complete len:317 (-) Transcript_16522:868-1818(-)|eukprot:CAMPEP_0184020994 /NCGR_PEP_ID=MMETSP0954-20121128/9665_1 /TAXON_ID=627963 /ORGANISM="Aplanochytrium sp, Strain PBS07" /LENGTH=316 /DNA_ID=CAMNT_0026302931 /DNA_START=93 /DNA_END=1043 /DNA_ORIENTATION=+